MRFDSWIESPESELNQTTKNITIFIQMADFRIIVRFGLSQTSHLVGSRIRSDRDWPPESNYALFKFCIL